MFGTITKGGIADLKNVTIRADAHLRDASGDGLGVPVPKAGQTDFLVTHHAHKEMVEVCATYRTHGPTFVARAAEAEMQLLMWSERKNIEHRLSYEALQAVRAQVEAYNAVVQPIPNGPDDAVAASEAVTRVMLAHRTFYEDRRRGAFIDDHQAALNALPGAVFPTTHNPAKD